MRFPSSSAMIMLAVGALVAAVAGWFAPRVLLIGWLSVVAPLVATAVGAAMLICMLKLGRSRLLGDWNTPLATASPWLFFAPVLCVPLLFGADTLYGWNTNAAFVAQHGYLNVPFFAVRIVVYFAAFIGIAVSLPIAQRPSRLALLLIIAFVIANMTAFDWIVALTPHWHSSDFGLRSGVNGLLIAASLAGMWQAIHRRGTSENELRARIDGATLLFALDLGWIYLLFVDYITAWSGNLPDEATWYAPRAQGTWGTVIVAVVAVHVVIGALLLSRLVKRSPRVLLHISIAMLAAQWVEELWTVIPGNGLNNVIAVSTSLGAMVIVIVLSFAWLHFLRKPSPRVAHG
jgi:hypothetical protein